MAAENHPKYAAWREALDRLVDAETRYYTALMENRDSAEIQIEARELDEARAGYLKISAEIE